MELTEGHIYHIYNRGINKQTLFSSFGNYIFFLKKTRKYLLPVCDILAYCLMPNHFHFLIHANNSSTSTTRAGSLDMQLVSAGFKNLLSSYSKAYNKMYGRSGSLFVQNTRCKDVSFFKDNINYGFICFNYIHQNPWKAGMVSKIEDWEYSSFRDYIGARNGTLCNQLKAYELLALEKDQIYKGTYNAVDKDKIVNLV
jgi:putative transposase